MKARLIKRFEDEIVQLERELTQELPKEIQRARELGDLRENAEYAAAKERQRFVEARVSMLRTRVSQIQLMNLEKIPHDRAGFGSKLTLARKAASSPTSWSCRRTPIRTTGWSRWRRRSAVRSSARKKATRSACRRRVATARSRSSSSSPCTMKTDGCNA